MALRPEKNTFEMTCNKIVNDNRKIRLRIITGLIFCFVWISCAHSDKAHQIAIIWEEGKAKAVSIPRKLIAGIPEDSIQKLVYVRLAGNNIATPVLGESSITEDAVLFRPVIPFTRGLKYDVMAGDQLLSEIIIPAASGNAPEVLAIYPNRDTVPENLLKIYIQFSKPMQEGESIGHIVLIRNNRDTVGSVFLDLEPELWNKERTMLTLWLDPGRIKRDLQPNRTMGPPLKKGEQYRLLIRNDWRDQEGISLAQAFRKDFLVGDRDSLSPDPERWYIDAPSAGSIETMEINFHEPLDYALLNNTFLIRDSSDAIWPGDFIVKGGESALYFKPASSWKTGTYTIEIASRLEDNAGNNLNRLFDNDLTRKKTGEPKEVFRRSFRVK